MPIGPPILKTADPPADAHHGVAYLSATSMEPRMPMPTDYIHHAARLSRQLVLEAGPGSTPAPDAEYYAALAKALDQVANAIDHLSKRRD
jgi:hypothetical protein